MPSVPADQLLERAVQPVEGDDAAGPDLSYDPAFLELEQAARGTPERQMGREILPAQAPDWANVTLRAQGLLDRSKDLRVAIILSRALLECDGWAGFGLGMRVARGLLERYWESAHPGFDPDDGDATYRVNTLSSLAQAGGLVLALRLRPLVRSKVLGAFGLRDIELAAGRLEGAEGASTDAPAMATIDAAARECDGEELLATGEALVLAQAEVEALVALGVERLGAMQAPDLALLRKTLADAGAVVERWIDERGLRVTPEADDDHVATSAESAQAGGPGAASGIRSREDVVRALDQVCEYYARHEPSSPVPLLLTRARRLVDKDFLAILRDISPQSLEQVASLSGEPLAQGSAESGED